jgi:hypothetical protein
MGSSEATLEGETHELLEETRATNEQYESAHYDRGSGLNQRLEAIEEPLVRIAQQVDRQQRRP